MDERLPSLNGVRSFAAAARHLSFTDAARELYVTQGAISRSVRGLERELGVVLFNRAGRGIQLTPAGEAYYLHIAEAFGRISAATRSVRRTDQNGVLSISFLPTLALRWLCPRLPGFQRQHPDILVDVSAGDGPVHFSNSSPDLALRFGNGPWFGAEADLVMTEEVGVFCTPALLQGKPRLQSLNDLKRFHRLLHSTRPHAWEDYLEAFGITLEDQEPSSTFEHFFMIIEAAVAGMGIALLSLFLAREEVIRRRLVQICPETYSPPEGYYLLNAKGRGADEKIRMFKDWLFKEIRLSRST